MSIRWFSSFRSRGTARSLAALALIALALAGCGGGSGSSGDTSPSSQGTMQTLGINSRLTGTAYTVNLYLPPASAGARKDLPVIYALDGESWYQTLIATVQSAQLAVIVAAVQTSGQRARDFVPANTCTGSGGGNANYLDFIRQELIPMIESSVGGDPAKRILFGHSHGGSFVLYAMWAEAPARHSFKTYLASDASLPCMPAAAAQWEQDYAAAYTALPVRLQISYATQGNYQANLDYAQVIARRRYTGLSLLDSPYSGSHTGIVPQVLADGLAFALAGAP
ncbi:MAG: alpha/beta hydrolase-fold protein [Rubrivivax sp.]